jgi:hypothetical protein
MLTPYSPGKYVEKIVTTAEGTKFRVLFLVRLIGGEFKAQIISAEPIFDTETTPLANPDTLYLPVFNEKQIHEYTYSPSCAPILSPLVELSFFMSQPTRAPSIA